MIFSIEITFSIKYGFEKGSRSVEKHKIHTINDKIRR